MSEPKTTKSNSSIVNNNKHPSAKSKSSNITSNASKDYEE
jgi:hypothetical protein